MIALVLAGVAASAHQMNLSTAKVDVSPDRIVTVEVALKGSDADRVAGTAVFDAASDRVDARRLAASAAPILAYVAGHAVVAAADGAPCRVDAGTLRSDEDGVVAIFRWDCREVAGALVYRSLVLVDVDSAAREVVLIGGDASQTLLDTAQREVPLSAPPPALAAVLARYVEAGIEHIFLGYDHVAFLVAVMLWARRVWPIIKIVTAFTLAHSVTLSLAALDVLAIPSAIVEPAIALSIVFVAVENFFSRDIDRRWRWTFAFGLIHGFGFASALRAFGLPPGAVVPALGAFNTGVELGQIAIVALVIPALILADRVGDVGRDETPVRAARLVYALSSVIALLGCYWALERTILA
jgi:hydrogenase/urease accessory protein HupE